VNFKGLDYSIYLQFKKVFFLYLPRLCEHCLNPACVASCPSGALYKRDEDGIVLVDQERCRGWRFCVSAALQEDLLQLEDRPGREVPVLLPPHGGRSADALRHSCVGRIRYIGVLLYDAERIRETAAAADAASVYPEHLDILLDPHDPRVAAEAERQGIAETYLAAARRSPVYRLIKEWRLALPLHPEFRTLPMVWYVPPLSPANPRWMRPARRRHRLSADSRQVSGQSAHGGRRGTGAPGAETPGGPAGLHALREDRADGGHPVLDAVGLGTRMARTCTACWPWPTTANGSCCPPSAAATKHHPTSNRASCGYPR